MRCAYGTDGNVASVTGPSGVADTRVFDADGAVSQVNVINGGGTVAAWVYGRDQAQNVVSSTEIGVGVSRSWGYDGVSQLMSQSAGPAQSYSYDPAGDPTRLGSVAQSFDLAGELCWSGVGTGSCGGIVNTCG